MCETADGRRSVDNGCGVGGSDGADHGWNFAVPIADRRTTGRNSEFSMRTNTVSFTIVTWTII